LGLRVLGVDDGSTESVAGFGDARGADCGFVDDDDGTVLAANANPLQPPELLDIEQEPTLSPRNDGPVGLGFLNVPGSLDHEFRHSLNFRPR
jgi:hypothetical protein